MLYLSSMQIDLPSSVQKELTEKKKVIGGTKIDQERWRKKTLEKQKSGWMR